jgi:hypothetical protein
MLIILRRKTPEKNVAKNATLYAAKKAIGTDIF